MRLFRETRPCKPLEIKYLIMGTLENKNIAWKERKHQNIRNEMLDHLQCLCKITYDELRHRSKAVGIPRIWKGPSWNPHHLKNG